MTAKTYDDKITTKVLLCGSYAVGKTSLVVRFVDNVFVNNTMSTLGANFLKKSVVIQGEDEESILMTKSNLKK